MTKENKKTRPENQSVEKPQMPEEIDQQEAKADEPKNGKRVPFSKELLPGFRGANAAVAESQRRLGEARAKFVMEEKQFKQAKERFEAAKREWEYVETELMSSIEHATQSRSDFLRLGHHASKLPQSAKLDLNTMEFMVEESE